MIASSLRPLMAALRVRSRPRRFNRQQLLKLLAETNRGRYRRIPRGR
jgi:hypothetical protein